MQPIIYTLQKLVFFWHQIKTPTLSLLTLTFIAATTNAQNIQIKGRVVTEAGQPLVNASVIVNGSTNGVTTDTSGMYIISAPPSGSLVFSSIGFATQTVPINNRTTINITLVNTAQQLEQVVVVGYGTQRRRDVTGSVASVTGAEIAKQPVQTPTQAIQGRVAGVQVISSGEPNSLPQVRVRGTGSTLAGVNPLYVVDGVLTDDIRNINNSDIVSLDILKDASATAIYGMRAANGVVLITTKKGRQGRTAITYDGLVGVREATDLVDMAGENQYAGYLNEASIYYGSGSPLVPETSLTGANTDWYDEILRTGFTQNHNIGLSGGSERFTYYLSTGYYSDEGILKGNDYNRFTIRSNNEFNISKVFKLTSTVSYARGDANGANFDAFSNAYRAAPIVPAKQNGQYGNTSAVGNVANPLVDIEKNYNQTLVNRVQGNFGLDIKPISGLTLRSAMGIDLDYTKTTAYGYYYDGSIFLTPGGNQINVNQTLSLTKNDATRWIWDNTATYTKAINDHNFTLLAGVTAEEYKFNSLVGTANQVPANKDQWFLNAGATGTQTVVNTGDKYARNSYLGRLNYSFANRYLLTATFRADGTSRFSENNRWGYFPSVALGWNITEENFMADQDIFDNLKLRASWGEVGNDNISSALYYSIARQNVPYFFDNTLFLGIQFPNINDQDLKWEVTDEYDIGLDFTILNRKLSGTFDYYNKKTDNALIYITIPAILGDADNQYLTNATTITNEGVELGLTWTDKIGTDWNYSVSGNVAHNKNRIENLNGGQPLIGGAAGNYSVTRTDNGQPIASYYVLDAVGIFQSEAEIAASAQKDARLGDLIYRDVSGPDGKPDGIIDNNDRIFAGSYQPKVTYGFSGNVGYKNFDLSFNTYGTAGSKIYNGKKAARGTIQQSDNIEAEIARNRWTPNNPNTNIPRATLAALPASTFFVESGDFFRLNNLTIGYTLPKGTLDKAGINNLRVYLTAQNLLTITPYTGFTPEMRASDDPAKPGAAVLNQGVDINTYPTTRTFAFGVNLGF
jgi:TonB-dependent starch-binding outer membrane protein SusC